MDQYRWNRTVVVKDEANVGTCDVGLSGLAKVFKSVHVDLVASYYVPFNDSEKIGFVLGEIRSLARSIALVYCDLINDIDLLADLRPVILMIYF